MTEKNYRYQLRRTSKKFICPLCNHKTFKRYTDADGNALADHVGRCDRANHCAHHFTPKQYFAETNPVATPAMHQPVKPPRIDYIPRSLMLQTCNNIQHTSFIQYVAGVFGIQAAMQAAAAYHIGRSKYDGGAACIFWQVDVNNNVRSGKIIAYNAQTGKRIKQAEAMATGRGLRDYQNNYIACLSVNNMVRRKLNNKNLQFALCFFGEHLLAQHPHKVVGVVESEKTAVLLSLFMPAMVWIATGGASGCRWTDYQVHKVLQNRAVTFYPDYGYYNRTTQTTCYQEWCRRVQQITRNMPGNLTVSNTLETHLATLPREDQDLADVMVRGR